MSIRLGMGFVWWRYGRSSTRKYDHGTACLGLLLPMNANTAPSPHSVRDGGWYANGASVARTTDRAIISPNFGNGFLSIIDWLRNNGGFAPAAGAGEIAIGFGCDIA